MKIEYIKGDVTNIHPNGINIICHVCNNADKWGAGFVLALSRRWPRAEIAYHECPKNIGDVYFVEVETHKFGIIYVCNMIAMHGVYPQESSPLRYDALAICLSRAARFCMKLMEPPVIHMPKIGTGLAKGNWDTIRMLIEYHMCDEGIPVKVYEL